MRRRAAGLLPLVSVIVEMPKLTDTMEEGVLVRWAKKVGDKVEPGDVLAEIETDKATMEYEAVDRGVLLKTLVPEGTAVMPGVAIAVIGAEGEEGEEVAETEKEKKETSTSARTTTTTTTSTGTSTLTTEETRRSASPYARKKAREAGLEVEEIAGTGPGGRVIARDIETAAPKESILSPMRKTIARRMTESKQQVPHFYLMREIDADGLVKVRAQLARDMPAAKISYNDLIVRACALALRKHPEMNASYVGDRIVRHESIAVGIAVAIPDGLVTPVLRGADTKSVMAIAEEARALAERARTRKLAPNEMQGGTFTISNLGMFGVSAFSAIINPPEVAILAVGAVERKPVLRDDSVTVGHTLTLSLSCDHRAVDGAQAAQFLATLADSLEHPLRMVL